MLLSELALRLGAELHGGGGDLEVTGISTIIDAGGSEVCYYGNPRYEADLQRSDALAVIASSVLRTSIPNILVVEHPYMAFREALLIFGRDEGSGFTGLHPSAVIHPDARLHETVEVGPNAVVDSGVIVGAETTIGTGSCIGPGSVIGAGCCIHPGVFIYRRSILGDRVTVHSGTVIGSDGFGFVPDARGHLKIPQNGTVEIGCDVEIGAGTTIDRAVIGSTCIGDHTKLDNLVQIAHNVTIGRGCLIAAQTGIAGSTSLGDGVVCGGQAGIGGHLKIGDGAVIAAQSGVMKDVPAGVTVSGYPARPHGESLRIGAAVMDLPELRRRVVDFMRNNDGRTEEDSR